MRNAAVRGLCGALGAVVLLTGLQAGTSFANGENGLCGGTATSDLEVHLKSPKPRAVVDVAKTPEFLVDGDVEQEGGPRLSSVQVYVGSQLAGTAALGRRERRTPFSLRTGAPAGRQTITVCARTADGRTGSASTTVKVVWPKAADVVVDPDTRVLTPEQVRAVVSVTPSAVVFKGSVPFVPGNILVGAGDALPRGLLRTVLSVRRNAGTTTVRTAAASLTDALLQAHVDQAFDLEPAGGAAAPRAKALRPSAAGRSTFTTPTFEFTQPLVQKEIGDVLSVDGEVGASGSLSLVVRFDISLHRCGLSPCARLDSAEVRVDGTLTASAALTVAAQLGKIDTSTRVLGVRFSKTFVFPVGGIPVAVTAVLEVSAGVRASAGLRYTFSWESSRTVSAGVVWNRGSGLDAFHSLGASAGDVDGPDQHSQVLGDADLYVRPDLSVFLYGAVGPTFQLEAGGQWGLKANLPDPCPGEFTRGAYFEPIIGAKLAVFAVEIAERVFHLQRFSSLTTSPLSWCSTPPTLRIDPATLPDATVAVSYRHPLTATGGTAPYSWSLIAGTLPAGISIGPDDVIAGTPAREGSAVLRLRVTDATGAAAEAEMTLRTNPALPPIQPGGGSPDGGAGGSGPPLPAPVGCAGGCATSWGDPHLTSFDGVPYDLQLAGEFVLTRSAAGDLDVQVRQEPWGGSRTIAANTAVALTAGGHTLEVDATADAPVIRLDGAIAGTPGTLPLGAAATAEVSADRRRVTVTWLDGSFVTVDSYGGASPYLSLSLGLADSRRGTMSGLLGNADAVPADDFTTRSGEVLPVDGPAREAGIRRFGDSWRLGAAESHLTYGPGQSSGTFTDLAFPYGTITVDALPSAQRSAAEAACAEAGVQVPQLLDACVLDVAVTGDTTTASAAVTAQGSVVVVDGDVFRVTAGVPERDAPTTGYVFLDRTVTMTVPAGARLLLSSSPDGAGDVVVDDRVQVDVTHEDGSGATFVRGYEFQPPSPALDLTGVVSPGRNTFRIRLMDTVGGKYSSPSLYLVVVRS